MVIFGIPKIISIFQLGRVAYAKYKWHVVLLTTLGFTAGLLEGLGVNALIPLFSFAFGQEQAEKDFISRQMERLFGVFHIPFGVNSLLVFIILLFIFKALFTLLINYLKAKIVSDYEIRTRTELFGKVLRARWPYLLQQKLGHLESVLMVDVSGAASLFNQISNTLTMIASLTVYLLVAINISVTITMITLALGGVLFFALRPVMTRVKGTAAERTMLYKDIAHMINENTLGMKTVKTMQVREPVIQAGQKRFSRWQDLTIKSVLLKSLGTSLVQPFGVIFIVLVFALTYRSTTFTFAALAAIIYLIERIFVYLGQLLGTVHSVNDLVPSLRSVLGYQELALQNREADQGKKPFIFGDRMVFKNVDFSYQGKEAAQTLKNISFEIQKGEIVGLIGPSGVGKTTLVDLILRLFTPTGGQILLDNVDIGQISLDAWRKQIGYVSQDIFLTNDTIKNNIRFYDDSLSDADIAAAARQANIYDFIQTLPKKFDTLTGERGVLISAGQKQRLVIARVLARKPQFLILDEATSSLDNESELLIEQVILGLKKKITVLMIAHRLSTLSNVDKLVVLENGGVREQGVPAVLLSDKKSYFYRVRNVKGVMP